MVTFRNVLQIFMIVNKIVCEDEIKKNNYSGEKFPKKFLVPENFIPKTDDLVTYVSSLTRVLEFYAMEPNKTDVNDAVTIFFTKGVIKRALLEDGHKLLPYQRTAVKNILLLAEYIMSHHLYRNALYIDRYGVPDNEYKNAKECQVKRTVSHSLHKLNNFSRGNLPGSEQNYFLIHNDHSIDYWVTKLFRDEDILANALPDFNENKLKKWILSRGQINDFIEDIDNGTLPKDVYAAIVHESASLYHIRIRISDKCLARVSNNPAPSPETKDLTSCQPDPYCKSNIHSSPSVAYSLSHRLLNMWMYNSIRRCFWVSPKDDELHMDILCAFMYREAVYIARRGFFARDIFMEHVALCGMRGYKEFYRSNWFKKVISWIDADCIREDSNFERNSTVTRLQYAETDQLKKRIRKILKVNLKKQCHSHPMAVLVSLLANAVRYAIHFVTN